MRILFLNSIGTKKFGGGERWMITAASGLAQRGHTVFVGGKKNGRFLQQAQRAGLTTVPLTIRSDISPLATWKIARFLRRERIDILVCNLNKDVRVAGLAARLVKTPIVIARHGVLLCGPKWKHKVTLTRLADGILTNTASIKAVYDSYGWFGPDFVKVIYNGVADLTTVAPYDFGQEYPGKQVIVSAGRLSEQKGFPFLIEAAALLRQQRDDFVVLIAGSGRLRTQLERLIDRYHLNSTVFLIGYRDPVAPLLRGSDIVALASLYEGMPNVILEAMAAAKPVVATAVNGIPELVEHEQTGLLVPPKNPEALATALQRLLDNPDLRSRYGQAGYERVRSRFTIDRMIDELEAYFAQKLAERQR